MQTIANRILKTEQIDIDRLTPFQGNLKTLDDRNFNKLRKSIIDEGFSFTVHVWENAGVIYIIDGHQRVSVLTQMRKQGMILPLISCSFVSADSYRSAKKLVLLAISQYGKIQKDGFLEFVDGENFNFDDYDIPDTGATISEMLGTINDEDFTNENFKSESSDDEDFTPSLPSAEEKLSEPKKLTLTVECQSMEELEDLFQELNSRQFKVKM